MTKPRLALLSLLLLVAACDRAPAPPSPSSSTSAAASAAALAPSAQASAAPGRGDESSAVVAYPSVAAMPLALFVPVFQRMTNVPALRVMVNFLVLRL